jgi:hypothetical protein
MSKHYAQRYLGFFALAFVLVCLSSASGRSEQTHQVNTEQKPESEIKPDQSDNKKSDIGPEKPTTPPTIVAPSRERESEPRKEKGDDEGTEFWPPIHGYRLKVTDTLIAVFTALLFIATIALYMATRGLAKGADDQLEHLKESAEKQLRAYVSFKEFSVTPKINNVNELEEWEINVVRQNTGATPTVDLLSHVSVRFEPTSIPDDFQFPDAWVAGKKQTYVPTYLAPGAINGDGAFVFSVSQMMQVQREEMFLHIYGWADYNDVFPGTPRRRTEFCARVLCPGNPHIRNPRNFTFEIHCKHNGADGECMRSPTTVARERIAPDNPKQNN